ncbi:MAG TPA: Imm8 family immunity protein [Acidimicrobiales bacterium]|nr:Imm8 family immunity protein [Acidimicrobiales bacterium]
MPSEDTSRQVPTSDSFNYWVTAEIGFGEVPPQDFSLNVVSTRWIEERRLPFPGLHTLVMPAFDEEAVDKWIMERISSIEVETEDEVLNKLCLYFDYDWSVPHWSHLVPPVEAQLTGPDEAGWFTVTIPPSSTSGAMRSRRVRYREDMQAIEEEWGIDLFSGAEESFIELRSRSKDAAGIDSTLEE